jgi:Tfp pilus assembly protein PilN
MRAVNLLPESSRPQRGTGRFGGSAYAIVGALAVALVMAAMYVLASNELTEKESEIAAAKAETQEAQERAGALTAFADFAQITQAREATVRDLAMVRFDWERVMREIAHVIPNDIWLLDMTASSSPQDSAEVSTTAPTGTPTTTTGPSLTLDGCAPSQSAVAALLVRLREMDRVDEVELGESVRQDTGGESAVGDSATGAEGSCPGDRFKFTVSVTFSAPVPGETPAGDESVPAALGGGS